MAELAVTSASDESLFTCAVAPHQVYGPRDNLFLPNLLEASGTGRLRIFGNGQNRICFTHVDNYAHGLIIAERALYKGSGANGKFYIVTDGDTHPYPQGYAPLWGVIDEAGVAMGFDSLWDKMKLPLPLLVVLAYIAEFVGWMIGTTLKLNRFNVKVRTGGGAPRALLSSADTTPLAPSHHYPARASRSAAITPHSFSHGLVCSSFSQPSRPQVLTMHRWFVIDAATQDLKYEPIIPYSEGWPDTLEWLAQPRPLPARRSHHSRASAKRSERIAERQKAWINQAALRSAAGCCLPAACVSHGNLEALLLPQGA